MVIVSSCLGEISFVSSKAHFVRSEDVTDVFVFLNCRVLCDLFIRSSSSIHDVSPIWVVPGGRYARWNAKKSFNARRRVVKRCLRPNGARLIIFVNRN